MLITNQTEENTVKNIANNILPDCDEVFLTGTAVEITPVSTIDNYKFEVGKISKLLIEEFRRLVTS